MRHKKELIVRLFLVLFSLSVSVTVIPCGLVIVHGLFWEIKSAAVSEEKQAAEEIYSFSIRHNRIRGTNLYNIWFEIVAIILYLIYISYMIRLPREETIVALKVRMDN